MSGLFGPILRTPTLLRLLRLVKGYKFPVLRKPADCRDAKRLAAPEPEAFNCRVRLTSRRENESVFEVFCVEICGSIHSPGDMHDAVVRVLITDVTDGTSKAMPARSRIKRWRKQNSLTFCYESNLGKIPNADTIVSDWMTVAGLHLDWLALPRKGNRNLQFDTSLMSAQTGEELACAACTITYENPEFGYIDLQENTRQAKILAVALAFAVSAADSKLYNCEVELIKNWARSSINFSKASNKAKHKLDKALSKAIDFFHNGNQVDVYKICKEIVELAPVAVRYDILELCLKVSQVNGVATAEELGLLKNIASRLEVDMDRFREMMGKILPATMHKVKDLELMLGVSPNMDEKQTQRQLNKEYRKWNARVTNSNPQIRKQADDMLDFIAKARGEFATKSSVKT